MCVSFILPATAHYVQIIDHLLLIYC